MPRILSTLTTRGRSFLSAGVATTVCSVLLGEPGLLRVGILLLTMPVITALVATRSRYLLSCHRTVVPTRIPADTTATVAIHIENPGRVPTGLLLLEDRVPYVLGSRPRFVIDQLRPRWTRDITYPVRASVRGRYQIGPLTVRMTDPFGFVELSRSFTARTSLTVTPTVHRLAAAHVSGDWSGSGEQRPRAFAAAGTEDVTVREYRQGDDRRRIHWPSTAKAGELMVRREEQPHHSRVTLLLDNRADAHRGKGAASSFEWSVSAIASVGAHLNARGFTTRLVSADSAQESWHDRGVSREAELDFLLDELSLIQTVRTHNFAPHNDHTASGLVVACLGSCRPIDIAALNAQRIGSSRSLAIVMDVERADTFSAARTTAESLRYAGWVVVVATAGDRVADVWGKLTAADRLSGGPQRSWVTTSQGPAA